MKPGLITRGKANSFLFKEGSRVSKRCTTCRPLITWRHAIQRISMWSNPSGTVFSWTDARGAQQGETTCRAPHEPPLRHETHGSRHAPATTPRRVVAPESINPAPGQHESKAHHRDSVQRLHGPQRTGRPHLWQRSSRPARLRCSAVAKTRSATRRCRQAKRQDANPCPTCRSVQSLNGCLSDETKTASCACETSKAMVADIVNLHTGCGPGCLAPPSQQAFSFTPCAPQNLQSHRRPARC